MKKKFLGLLAGLILGGQTAQALDNDKAITLAMAGVSALGGAAYQVTQKYPMYDQQFVYAGAVMAAALFSGILYSVSEYSTYRKIADHLDYIESKGKWACKKELNRHKNYLFNVEMTASNFDEVLQEADCESVDFPLIDMFKRLQEADAKLIQLRNLSDKAMFNTLRKQGSFYKKLEIQRVRLDGIIKRVRGNISVIKQHRLWEGQWKMYQTKEVAFAKVHLQLAGHAERGV